MPRERLFEDWEFVLCDVSALGTVALLPGLQRCLERVDTFFTEQEAALQQVGATELQRALRSRHMLQFPMATFARVLLERYLERFTAEQREMMSIWEARLCQISAEGQEELRRSCAAAFTRVQAFLANFADDIVQLPKPTLMDVVRSNQTNRQAEWMHARNFFRRQHHVLTAEEKIFVGRLGVGSLR